MVRRLNWKRLHGKRLLERSFTPSWQPRVTTFVPESRGACLCSRLKAAPTLSPSVPDTWARHYGPPHYLFLLQAPNDRDDEDDCDDGIKLEVAAQQMSFVPQDAMVMVVRRWVRPLTYRRRSAKLSFICNRNIYTFQSNFYVFFIDLRLIISPPAGWLCRVIEVGGAIHWRQKNVCAQTVLLNLWSFVPIAQFCFALEYLPFRMRVQGRRGDERGKVLRCLRLLRLVWSSWWLQKVCIRYRHNARFLGSHKFMLQSALPGSNVSWKTLKLFLISYVHVECSCWIECDLQQF